MRLPERVDKSAQFCYRVITIMISRNNSVYLEHISTELLLPRTVSAISSLCQLRKDLLFCFGLKCAALARVKEMSA